VLASTIMKVEALWELEEERNRGWRIGELLKRPYWGASLGVSGLKEESGEWLSDKKKNIIYMIV